MNILDEIGSLDNPKEQLLSGSARNSNRETGSNRTQSAAVAALETSMRSYGRLSQRKSASRSFSQYQENKRRSTSELLERIQFSTKITQKEHNLLNQYLTENSDDTIRRKLVQKYNTYYRHWKDLNYIVALFAMVGLVLTCFKWEAYFNERGPDGQQAKSTGYTADFVVFIVSIMGAVAILMKYYFQSIWLNYKNPVAFYKTTVRKLVEIGVVDEESLT